LTSCRNPAAPPRVADPRTESIPKRANARVAISPSREWLFMMHICRPVYALGINKTRLCQNPTIVRSPRLQRSSNASALTYSMRTVV
jgi:hypothetical protein